MKIYYLEELFINENGKLWRKIIETYDLRKAKKMKKILEEKTKNSIYRVVQVR